MAPLSQGDATQTHWHILGAGSMGCLWAAYLSQAGHQVTVLAKHAYHAAQLRQQLPLRCLKSGNEFSCDVAIALPQGAAPIQHLLVCLKAWQTQAALPALFPLLAPDATVILLQNGMGNPQWLAAQLPGHPVYAAISTEAACLRSPLQVEHTGDGETQLGLLTSAADSQLLQKLACALPCRLSDDIDRALWQKLVVNCCINPLTVKYRCKNGELASNTEAQQLVATIIAECRGVAAALGKAHYLESIEHTVAQVIERTADNTSSMLQDVLNGRPTEIGFINGFVAREAGQLGMVTPVCQQLVDDVEKAGKPL